MKTTETPFSNNAMNVEEIKTIMRECITSGATMRVRMITRVNTSKGCPFEGDCFKDSTSLYISGCNYEKVIKAKLARLGIDSEFKAEASNVGVHDDNLNLILYNEKKDTYYISLFQEAGTKRETKYIHADGRVFSEYELGILQGYLPKQYESKKQADAGLKGENQIRWFSPNVKNIMEIKQGELIKLVEVAEAKA